MSDYNVALPSKPRVVSEDEFTGVYEIEGLYAGYGYTLGNSLRRIVLSSLPGAAVVSIKLKGADHEFSTLDGVLEDTIAIILNVKRLRFQVTGDEPVTVTLTAKGEKSLSGKDITLPGQVEIRNPDQHIATLTSKNATFDMELRLEKGLGYVAKEVLQREKVEIGTIALDAIFSPIRRVNYEVENMRVGDRTDYNRLKVTVETDGSISPRKALEDAIEIMITQLKAIVGFKEEETESHTVTAAEMKTGEGAEEVDTEFLKTRIDSLDLSARTQNALSEANIRTVGGLVKKHEDDLLALEGLGEKGIQEIKRALSNFGVTLKQ
jgi:DNA-directed RNA polymerase subunit alpha